MTRVPLDANTAARWSEAAHVYVIEALMSESPWSCEDIAFHGGTSLHLSWRSPRFSEDLDFLLADKERDLDKVMRNVERRVQEMFLGLDPSAVVEMRNKTRDPDRMPVFHCVVTKPGLAGKVMVKVEFWRVDRDYLQKYATAFRTPASDDDMILRVQSPVPAATLESAFCDKLTAIATRPHLKWRDIFDIWWIGTQSSATIRIDDLVEPFLHHLSAYQTIDDLPPEDALARFLGNDVGEMQRAAAEDLQRWLPDVLWRRLNPHGIKEMVEYARGIVGEMSDKVRRHRSAVEGPSR